VSQGGILTISDAILPPDVPTSFVGNTGSGSPVGNVFDIVGTGTISTSVVGNVLTISSSGGGSVTSVSGTLDRITSTGGTTPVIDIAATYVGQTSITTLGTIATGVWNGTAVDATHGGTNQTTYAAGDILYASAINTLAKLPVSTDGKVLTLVSGLPSWQTSTGGVTSITGTANQIAASSPTGAVTLSLVGPYTPTTYTSHGVLIGAATSSIVATTAGTAGYLLKSGGASADPSFAAASAVGASLFLLSTQTASASATIDFTNIQVATPFRKYLLIWRGVSPTTDADVLWMQCSSNNGASWITTTYQAGCNITPYNSSVTTNTSSTANFLLSTTLDSASAVNMCNGSLMFFTPGANYSYMNGSFSSFDNALGSTVFGTIGGRIGSTGINALRMIMSTGTIALGSFTLYGISES